MLRGMIAIALAMAAGTAHAADKPTAQQTRFFDRLQTAFAKAKANDCQASMPLLAATFDDPTFAALTEPGRAAVYQVGVFCAHALKDNALVYRYAFAATQLQGAEIGLWFARLNAESEGKRHEQAVATIEAMASQNPAVLNMVSSQWLAIFNRDLRQAKEKALQARLLAVVTAPAYQPDDVLMTGDTFKRDYAALLVDAGRKADAAALVARIVDLSDLIAVSVDPRLRTMLPADFDGRAPAERRLAQLREIAASHPGSLRAVNEIAQYLRQLGRIDEAVAALEAARPDGPQGQSFTDLGEYQNWWWNEIANNYLMLGRYDDAVAAFRRGIDAKEYAGFNVSQTINLASAQLRFGHPAEALATLATFEKGKYSASPFGEMQLHRVRGCARATSGQSAAASDDAAYIVAHARDAPGVVTAMMLCTGDMDAAAAAVIRELDDPDDRQQALLLLSDYDPAPPHYPRSPDERRLPDLKARADVKAAIARAGGTRRFRLQD